MNAPTHFAIPPAAALTLAAAAARADADGDWALRSTAPSVYTAVGFDTAAEVENWTFPDSTADHVSWERTVTASGDGALRFDILRADRAGSGSWVHWLSDDQREFDEGDEFYVQFRQYVPAYYATHRFAEGNGWKQIIISRRGNVMGGVNVPPPYGSNQLNEIVLQNTNHRGVLQGYNRDSNGAYPPWEVRADTRCSQTDFVLQNAVDRGPDPLAGLSPDNDPWTPCEQDRARFGGLFWYYATRPDGYEPGAPDPLGGAFDYYPDEWLTFYLHVRLGRFGADAHDTHVTLWAARESDSAYTRIIDRNDIDLGNGPRLDALWLLPFNTNRLADPSREDTYTLYDELIVSANPIPVPTAGLSFGLYASAPQVEAGSTVTLTWNGDPANACVASGAWSGNRAGAGTQTVGPLLADSRFDLTCMGANGVATRSAQVAVTPMDTVAPVIERVSAVGDPSRVTVTFSESVAAAGAETPANYRIAPSVAVLSAERVEGSADVVRLTTSTLVEGAAYTVAVDNVTDESNAQNPIAADAQASFGHYASLAGSGTAPAAYRWERLDVDAPVYIDRAYSYATVPAQYAGLDYLMTANADKNVDDPDFLRFDLLQAAAVFVGHDRRIADKPAWLDTWETTGDSLFTTDAAFDVFVREFPAGEVTLGGNAGDGNSMYVVIVGPAAPDANSMPVAVPDTVSTAQGVSTAIDVLANDGGLGDPPFAVKVLAKPAHGTVRLRNNRIVYTPAELYAGVDRLRYRVVDRDGDAADGDATIVVYRAGSGSADPRGAAAPPSARVRDLVDVAVAGGGAIAPLWLFAVGLLALARRRAAFAGLLLLAAVALGAQAVGATELRDAAQALAPGEFVELETNGLTRDRMTQNGCASPITSFTDNAVWDPVSRRFLFIGGPHGCPHAFVEYREATNGWANLPPLADSATHAYDHTTIDVASREVFFRKHSAGGFHRYDLNAGSWSLNALPTPSTPFTQVSGGLEYFPDLDRLVHINYGGAGEVDIFEDGDWVELDRFAMGERAAFIEYNPVHQRLLFGGGVSGNSPATVRYEVYVMDANRQVVRQADAPLGLAITKSIVTVDPVSGKYLVFGNGDKFYEYDVLTDTWRQLTTYVPFLDTVFEPENEVFGTVAAPVSTYGVVMFLQYLGSGSKVWLYRHEDSGPPDATPPGVPGALSGAALDAASVALGWNAADDAQSGVVGYNVYRDGALLDSTPATDYVDAGLADATAYTYEVAAINGSGLTGERSVPLTLSTLADVERPTLVEASAFGDAQAVELTFSEPVSAASAANAGNYAVSAGVAVYAAELAADERTVTLSTSSLSASVPYTVTVSNVADQATTPNWIASGSQIDFTYRPSVAGTGTVPSSYAWSRLAEGEPVYVDRGYVYTDVPAAYANLDYLLTANDDKGSVGAAFVTFELPQPATVFVAFDERAAVLPQWLGDWTARTERIVTSDTAFDVYARDFPAGVVSLGGNEGSSPSMYVVIVEAAPGDGGSAQPVAVRDVGRTAQGRALGLDVLANDRGLDDAPIALTIASAPAHGSASVIAGRVVAYVPDAGFAGVDSLSYRITDADGGSATASIAIKVERTGRDAQPQAASDVATTPQDVPVTVAVLANDTGLVDAPVALSIVVPPGVGTAKVVDGERIRYTPAPNLTGVDRLTYRLTDVDGDVSDGELSVVVFAAPP
ncbi:MAG: Ig-like domain-containing protein [Pseudomonadota bacterium]